MKRSLSFLCLFLLTTTAVHAQLSSTGSIPAAIHLPSFNAKLALGFNYDMLRPLTAVSFDYSKGYLGFNIPFDQTVNPLEVASGFGAPTDSLFADTTMFANGSDFRPSTGFKQYANSTIRVDVPMLGGVCSFSNTQNFYVNYITNLGSANIKVHPDSLASGIGLILKGNINVPIEGALGWETMSFGYAYRVNRNLMLAMNLSRHIFRLDMLAKVDVNLLGKLTIKQSIISLEQQIDYPSTKTFGYASGHYGAEAWSPSFAIQAWRLSLTSRFGFSSKAKGTFEAKYALPFFIDPKTFQINLPLSDPAALMKPGVYDRLLNNETDSIRYYSNRDADWNLPSAHTVGFDIIPQQLTLSYTKLFGEISMFHKNPTGDSTAGTPNYMTDLDLGITIDHIMMLSGNFKHLFFNVGIFTVDFRINNEAHMLGNVITKSKMGIPLIDNAPFLPVLNFGSAIGSKIQLALECDILPLPAVKTGIIYYF